MAEVPSIGSVLVIADDHERAGHLAHSIAAAGLEPLTAVGPTNALIEDGAAGSIDLVVTDLDATTAAGSRLLERLIDGEMFFGVPQLHVLHDPALCQLIADQHPDFGAVSAMVEVEPVAFRARVLLAAEVGRLRREIAEVSVRDELTGAFNRRYVLMRLEQEVARARRYGTPLAFVLLDLDGLEQINERHGQRAGDEALVRVTRLLDAQVRREDVKGRWSGGSFAVILPGARSRGAAVFANKIRGDVASGTIESPAGHFLPTVSAGIASFDPRRSTASPGGVVSAAELALGEARNRGGNRVHIDEAALVGERRSIVIADPDPVWLDAAEDLLPPEEFGVIRAGSTEILLETLRRRRPDLLVIDFRWIDPERSPGLLERLRALDPERPLPIIALAPPPGVEPERLRRLGVARYVTKPFSVGVLAAIARELLHARPADRHAPAG